MSVTADDPRYEEWPSRKPSKYQKEASKLYEKPGEYVAEKVIKAAHRKTSGVQKTLAGAVATVARNPVVATVAGGAASIAAGLAIIAAANTLAQQLAKSGKLALGDKLNALSRDFVTTQRTLIRAYAVSDWQHVPQQVRDEAVKGYKAALATASSQAQGSAYAGVRAEGSYK